MALMDKLSAFLFGSLQSARLSRKLLVLFLPVLLCACRPAPTEVIPPLPSVQAEIPGTIDANNDLLQRPLGLMVLRAGKACPVSSSKQVSAQYGPAIGDGPVYAVGLGSDGILQFSYHVDGGARGQITVRATGESSFGPGDRIWLTPEKDRIHRFNMEGRAIR
jgi:hypothetical protein